MDARSQGQAEREYSGDGHRPRADGQRGTVTWCLFVFFFQAEDGIRDVAVTGVQTCALPILLAKAAVQNPKSKVRIAEQLRAQITWGIHEGPVVPVLAVQRINGEFFAFVAVNEGKGAVARQRVVKLGDTVGNDFAVLDGLKPGDHIIVSGTQFLQDGMPVSEQMQNDDKSSTGK